MKNIEIVTSQNVVLQYELAPLNDRVFAFMLDMFSVGITVLILIGILSSIFSDPGILVLFLLALASIYSLLFEFFNDGRSLGKMAMKIQVIKLSGGRATFSDYAARWVFRLIDIHFSLGGIASILIISSPTSQRIGDIIANTAVVKTQPKLNINLKDLLSIHTINKHVPKYQRAKKLQEQDALLIKATLERYRRFRNDSHREAIKQLAKRVQDILEIDTIEEDRSVFLQTILQDYVVLSRQ